MLPVFFVFLMRNSSKMLFLLDNIDRLLEQRISYVCVSEHVSALSIQFLTTLHQIELPKNLKPDKLIANMYFKLYTLNRSLRKDSQLTTKLTTTGTRKTTGEIS